MGVLRRWLYNLLTQPDVLVANLSRYVMRLVGICFILGGVGAVVAEWWELVKEQLPSHMEKVSILITGAEFFLIAVLFVVIGRSIIVFSRSVRVDIKDVETLKDQLIAMVISISGVVFINMISNASGQGVDIDVLYAGLAVAAVAIGLGAYSYLSGRAKAGRSHGKEPEDK